MNKEQLFLKIDEIYSEWHGGDLHIGKERTERVKEVLNKAINYRQCCKSDSEQLCECKNTEPEIDGWVRCKDCGDVFMV